MRLPIGMIAFLAAASFSAEALFQTRSVAGARLSAEEAERYDRIKKAPGVVRAKLVEVNAVALSRSMIQLEFFDGVRSEFSVENRKGEALWKGKSGRNFDRFVIRKIGNRYSGQVLHDGRRYVLMPLQPGVSVLYQQNLERIDCGTTDTTRKVVEARHAK